MISDIRRLLFMTLFLCVAAGCSSSSSRQESTAPDTGITTVYTVNYPLAYFAERIGGEHVNVVFPVPADDDPAYWTPNAETIAAYQQADLILLNGADYAKWVPHATLPESTLVNTTAAVADKYITIQEGVAHSHGPGESHTHEGIAITTWLDPEISIAQAEAVVGALADHNPTYREDFQQNFASLKADLEALDQKIDAAVKEVSQQPVVFSHPVFQYLTRRYELDARSVHWEPDVFPSNRDWAKLEELLAAHPAKCMIWEGEPLVETKDHLAERGVDSVVFDPCGNRPAEGDWLQVMRANAEYLLAIEAP